MTKRLAALFVVAVVALMGSISGARAQSDANADIAAITALEKAWVKADLAGDKAFVQKTFADDYSMGLSKGKWYTKAMYLKDMDDPKNKTNHEETSELKVRLYGATAIATYTLKYDGLDDGKPTAGTYIVTDTFARLDGGWKIVASHMSRIQ